MRAWISSSPTPAPDVFPNLNAEADANGTVEGMSHYEGPAYFSSTTRATLTVGYTLDGLYKEQTATIDFDLASIDGCSDLSASPADGIVRAALSYKGTFFNYSAATVSLAIIPPWSSTPTITPGGGGLLLTAENAPAAGSTGGGSVSITYYQVRVKYSHPVDAGVEYWEETTANFTELDYTYRAG